MIFVVVEDVSEGASKSDFQLEERILSVVREGGFDREETPTVNVTICATSIQDSVSNCEGNSLHKAIVNVGFFPSIQTFLNHSTDASFI